MKKLIHNIKTYFSKSWGWISKRVALKNNNSLFFNDIPILQGVSKRELRYLNKISSLITLNEGEFLFHENDPPKELFIIAEGELEVYKLSTSEHRRFLIKKLSKGDVVGEMSLIDNKLRSASIKASCETKVIQIPFDQLQKLVKTKKLFSAIFINISKAFSQRLRDTNVLTVQALEKELAEYELRNTMGHFMIYLISMLCLYTYALNALTTLSKSSSSASFVTLVFMIILLIAFLSLMKATRFSFKHFGLTLTNWKQNVLEALIFTIPMLAVVVLIKWIEITFFFTEHQLFEPFYAINSHYSAINLSTGQIWSLTLILYCFVVTPIQEVVIRGGLQSALQMFLTNKKRIITAIILSNLIFSAIHTYLSLPISLLAFFLGIFLGFLYARHKTLLSPYISHVLIGTWAFWIVGLIA